MHANFDLVSFTKRLIGETLFYDDEYFIGGTLSLYDPIAQRELYLAAFLPDTGDFVIEKASQWEDYDAAQAEEGVEYAMATDSEEHGFYETLEAVSDELFKLAQEQGLLPSITLRYDEDEE